MLITEEQLDQLQIEYSNLMENPEYVSNHLYTIITQIARNFMNCSKYRKVYSDWKDDAELECVLKCLKALHKYEPAIMTEAQIKRGHKKDERKALYAFIEMLVRNKVYDVVNRHNKFKIETSSIDVPGEELDIASFDENIVLSNQSIDEEFKARRQSDPMVIARRVAFEAKLVELEANNPSLVQLNIPQNANINKILQSKSNNSRSKRA